MLVRAFIKYLLSGLLLCLCSIGAIGQSGMIDIDFKITNPSACNQSDGAIEITPLNGIAPFEYSINGGAIFQTDSSFLNLRIGTYILLVRDAQQQISSFKLAKLEAAGAPSIRGIVMADPMECGQEGTLKILAEGGIGDLQYSIDSGATFQSNHIFTDVAAGFYHIVVKNNDDSCPASYPTISFAPQSPSNFIDIQPVLSHPECEQTNGSILLNVGGGSGDYLYSINNGETYQSSNLFENLGAGEYAVVIRDTITKCDKQPTDLVVLEDENCKDCEEVMIDVTTTQPDCEMANGIISIAVSGGSGDYLYSINDGQVYQNEPTFDTLAQGSYTIRVKDNNYDCEKALTSMVNLAPTNCPNCDSITIQSFLTLPDCDSTNGRIELTITGGSGDYSIQMTGGDFQSDPTFNNLASGSYSFVVKDNQMGCEKSFSSIDLTTSDCSCTLGLIDEKELSATAVTCEQLATVCLNISLEALMELEVLDNGLPYNGGLQACEMDTMLTYLYFTLPSQGIEGPYRLDRWELNDSIYTGEFQHINDLVDMMNQYDPNANWERDSSTMTLKGGFAGNAYGALEITQIATDMTGVFQLNTNILPINAKISLAVGEHELIFNDKMTNCKDTLKVTVDCPPCPQIAIVGAAMITSNNCEELAKVCFTGADSLDLTTYTITDNGEPYTGPINNCPDLILGFNLSIDTGAHQIIFEDTEIDCQFIFDLQINCTKEDTIRIDTIIQIGQADTMCFPEYLMNEDITSITPTCEGASPSVGFEINNLNNCIVFEGLDVGMDTICLSICEEDNTCQEVIITVTVLDSMMVDTMTMDSMMVDTMMMDSTCQSIFMEHMATLDLVNCMDTGFYCLNLLKTDLANYDLTINGVAYTEIYPDCDVPEQASLALTEGMYQLILSEKVGTCRDTAQLRVQCEPETIIFEDTIMVNETDTFCFDNPELQGDIVSIENSCEENSGEHVIIEVDTLNHCIYYTGVENGTETACIVTCDSLGNCDTTTVIITVEEEEDTIALPIAIDDRDSLEEGATRTINVLGNDTTNSTLITVTIIDAPTNGIATVNADLTITYMANNGICDTTDYFTYELCNPRGCDTAQVALYIACKDFLIFDGFSPNGDGVNETFTIEGIEDFPNNNVQIFNRWGTRVFEQKGYKGQWDGSWNGKVLPDGTYFYLLDDGEGKKYSGFLQIQR